MIRYQALWIPAYPANPEQSGYVDSEAGRRDTSQSAMPRVPGLSRDKTQNGYMPTDPGGTEWN